MIFFVVDVKSFFYIHEFADKKRKQGMGRGSTLSLLHLGRPKWLESSRCGFTIWHLGWDNSRAVVSNMVIGP